MGVALLEGEVHLLVIECKSGKHLVISANYDANSTVWAIVRVATGIAFVFVGFETKLVKSLLDTFMKWHRIRTKWYYFSFAVNLEVKMFAREIVVVVSVLILYPIGVLVPSATFRLIAFRSSK